MPHCACSLSVCLFGWRMKRNGHLIKCNKLRKIVEIRHIIFINSCCFRYLVLPGKLHRFDAATSKWYSKKTKQTKQPIKKNRMLHWVDASVPPSELFKSTLSSDRQCKLNCSPHQPTVSALDVHYLESRSGIDRGAGAVEAVMQEEQPPANRQQTGRKRQVFGVCRRRRWTATLTR